MKELSKINAKVLGSLIKIHRIQQNMSQKALCEGICVASYLSKIENAEVIPTQEMIYLLFDALGITYEDSEEFLLEARELIEDYLEKLTFSDFKSIDIPYHKIMSQGERYIHSSLIIEYYLVQLARYCATPDKGTFQEADKILKEVLDLMDKKQRLLYCLYKGIDLIQLTTEYESGIAYLKQGTGCGENGHLFYWMAQGYMYENKLLKALKYAEKSVKIYVKEVNVNGIMCTYELLSKIYSSLGEDEESEVYLKRALKMCRRLDEPSFEGYLHYRLAWNALNRGETKEAISAIEKDKCVECLIPKLTPWQVKLFIYHKEGNKEQLKILFKEKDASLKEKNNSIAQIFKLYVEEKEVLKKGQLETYLLESIVEVHKIVEAKRYLQDYLVQYYKYNRRYKEALEICEKIIKR